MEIAQTQVEARVQDMEMDAGNLQDNMVGIAAAIGEVEVVKVAVVEGPDRAIQEMEVDAVNQVMEIALAAVGEVAAEKAAIAVIPINISVEDNQDVMIIISPEEAAEIEAVKVPAWEEAVQVLLQAGEADAAVIGNLFQKQLLNNTSMKNQKTSTNGAASTNGTKEKDVRNKNNKTSLLEKFFVDQLKDVYYAEQHLVKALPEMKNAATSEELEDAFDDHLKQTERHVKRLERVFKLLGKKAEGKKCEAIEGLTKEAKSIISETTEGSMTRDAALIIAAQKIEHYEIATYGGLVQLAITMDLHQAAEILDKTLQEEEDTDTTLTQIAETSINVKAENEGAYSWQQQQEESLTDA